MEKRRVVITGMGNISPVGLDAPTMWQNLVAGRSGIGPITLFDTANFGVRIAGEAHGFDPSDYMSKKDIRRADRFTHFAIASLGEALDQSGLVIDEHNAHDVGVIVGSGEAKRGAQSCHEGQDERDRAGIAVGFQGFSSTFGGPS